MSAFSESIANMTITIPTGQPNNRFMRYVRAPIRDAEELPPLFPLQPATRSLRIGIDTTTLPVPPSGYLAKFFGRDEIDVELLVPAGGEVPAAWTAALHDPLVHEIGFTTVEEAGQELDTRFFWIDSPSERESCPTSAPPTSIWSGRTLPMTSVPHRRRSRVSLTTTNVKRSRMWSRGSRMLTVGNSSWRAERGKP